MSTFDNPFDPKRGLNRSGCSCGRHATQVDHERDAQLQCAAVESEDKRYEGVVASAVMRAIFPQDAARRAFLKVGRRLDRAGRDLAVLPARDRDRCVRAGWRRSRRRTSRSASSRSPARTPIIMAEPMGFYKQHGLNVEVIKTAGWAVIRDKTINKEYDAAHMLSPMPLAITLGAGSNPIPYTMPAIENINGQAITLAVKHKDKRDPKSWKGFKFAVPFDYSMHNYLLRYYVAEHGLDPDTDIQIRAVPPPEMVANLRADNIDGFLGPDPMNQRAVYDGVGFIHVLSKDIWEGHPCCAFAASQEFVTQTPNTYAALLKAIIDATAFATKAENRKQIAEAIAPANYHQPAGHGARADPDRHLRRRTRQGAEGAQPRRFRSVPVGIVRGLDHDPDEALGSDQGRRRLRRHRQAGLPRDRHHAADEGSRPDAADHDHQDVRRDGQDVRSGQAGGIHQELQDQKDRIDDAARAGRSTITLATHCILRASWAGRWYLCPLPLRERA